MIEEKVLEKTKEFTNSSLKHTQSAMELSKKLRKPSDKIARFGTIVGTGVAIGLISTGVVGLFIGKPLWSFGSISAGTISLISNRIYVKKHLNEKKKKLI